MNGAYIGNSDGRLQVSITELGTGQKYTMGQLSGQTVATFELQTEDFHSNQTTCMGWSLQDNKWTADLCQSELLVEQTSMKCTCNAF